MRKSLHYLWFLHYESRNEEECGALIFNLAEQIDRSLSYLERYGNLQVKAVGQERKLKLRSSDGKSESSNPS